MKLISVFKWCKLNESMSVKDWKNNFLPSKMTDFVREKVKNALDWYRLPENEDIRKDYPLESFSSVNNLIYSIEWLKNKKAYLNANRDESNYDTVFENEKFVIICPLNPNAAHKTAHYLFNEDGPEEYESDAGNKLVDYKHNRGWGGNLSPTWCIAASGMAQKYWKDYHLYDNHLTYFIFFKEKRYHGLRYALVLESDDFDSFLSGYDIGTGGIIREFRDPKQHRGHSGHIEYIEDYEAFLEEAGMDDEEFSEIIRKYAEEHNFSLKNTQRPEHDFDFDYWHGNVETLFENPNDEESLKEMCIDVDFYEREVYKIRDDIAATELSDDEDDNELAGDLKEDYPDLSITMEDILDEFVGYDPGEEYFTLIDKTIDLIIKNKNKHVVTGGYHFLYSLIYNRYRGSYTIDDNKVEKYSKLFKKIAIVVQRNGLICLFEKEDENTKTLSNVYYFYLLKNVIFDSGVPNYVLKSAIDNITSQKLLERILDILIKGEKRNNYVLELLYKRFEKDKTNFLEQIRKGNHDMWRQFMETILRKSGGSELYLYLINVYESGDTDLFLDKTIQDRFIKFILPKKDVYMNQDEATWGAYFVNNLILNPKHYSSDKKINPNDGIKYASKDYGEKSKFYPILNYFKSHPFQNIPMTLEEAIKSVKYTDELLCAISMTYTYFNKNDKDFRKDILSKIKENYPKYRNKVINFRLSFFSKSIDREWIIKETDDRFDYNPQSE